MSIESESKFRVSSFQEIENKLISQGKLTLPWHFEHNTVFDTAEDALRAQNILLRLRTAHTNSLTLKKPLPHPGRYPLRVKKMEEIETPIQDTKAMAGILQALGYRDTLHYEKFRSQWEFKDGIVCLDYLPFGKFVEIEGTDAIIADVARCLELDPAAATAATYHQLYQDHLRAAHLPPTDSFCFAHNERNDLSAILRISRTV